MYSGSHVSVPQAKLDQRYHLFILGWMVSMDQRRVVYPLRPVLGQSRAGHIPELVALATRPDRKP